MELLGEDVEVLGVVVGNVVKLSEADVGVLGILVFGDVVELFVNDTDDEGTSTLEDVVLVKLVVEGPG